MFKVEPQLINKWINLIMKKFPSNLENKKMKCFKLLCETGPTDEQQLENICLGSFEIAKIVEAKKVYLQGDNIIFGKSKIA